MENTADSLSVTDSSINDNKIRYQEFQILDSDGKRISDATVDNKVTKRRTSSISDNTIDKIITAFKFCCLILVVVAVNLAPIILYLTDQSDSSIGALSDFANFKSCSVSCDSSFNYQCTA